MSLKNIVGNKLYVSKMGEWIREKTRDFSLTLRGDSGSGKSFIGECLANEMGEKHGARVHILDRVEDCVGQFDSIFESITLDDNYVIVMNESHTYVGTGSNAASQKLVSWFKGAFSSDKTGIEITKPGNKVSAPSFKGFVIQTSFVQPTESANNKTGDNERRAVQWTLEQYSNCDLRTIANRMGFKGKDLVDGNKGNTFQLLISACRGYAEVLKKAKKIGGFEAVDSMDGFVKFLKLCGFYPHGVKQHELSIIRNLAEGHVRPAKLVSRVKISDKLFRESICYLEDKGLVFDFQAKIELTEKGGKWLELVESGLASKN